MAGEEPLELQVSGHCMGPFLESGGRVRVLRRALYLPGDVVAFRRSDDRLLIHRVLGYTLSRHGLRLLAKGDRLAREDEPVPLSSIVGRVVTSQGRPWRAPWRQRGASILAFVRTLVRRSIRRWASATSS
jgi:hypothetical protein